MELVFFNFGLQQFCQPAPLIALKICRDAQSIAEEQVCTIVHNYKVNGNYAIY